MKEAKKEAEALCNAFRAEKEAAYQASMQKVREMIGAQTRHKAQGSKRFPSTRGLI